MSARVLVFGCVFALACSLSAAASAEDSATAGALFEKGVADMQAGHFDSACPAIEESQRLDPRPGTLFTLAECQAQRGKVATASARYQEYVDLVSQLTPDQQRRHKARVDIARSQLAKLKPTLPTLTLILPKDAPAGTTVTRNGELLTGAALGLALPVDPGQYVIVTQAPGARGRESNVSLQLGEAKTLQLEVSAPPTSDAPAPPAPAPPSATAQPLAAPEPRHGTGRKTAAYVVGGVGVAGVLVGSVTGLLVLQKKSKVSDGCSEAACNQSGLDAANSGKKLATVSDVGFGIGIAGLAVGAVLLLTGGSEASTESALAERRWRPVLATGNGGFVTGVSHAF